MDDYYSTFKGNFIFIAKFPPNFDFKNMILTYAKDFSWKKSPKFVKFEILFFKSPNFQIVSR